jgi:CBS domain containing-hemolysin-like protein
MRGLLAVPLAAVLTASAEPAGTGGFGPEVILWILVLLLASGFFSGSETALVSARRSRLETMAESGRPDARTALRLLDRTPRTIATTLVGTNLANVGASSLTTLACMDIAPEHGAMLATVLLTPFVLLLGEILPKALFRSHATLLFRVSAPTLRVCDLLLSPLVALASGTTRGLLWLLRIPAAERRPLFRREDLGHVFLHAVTVSEPEEHAGSTFRMARKALDLKDKKVRDAMVPLPQDWTVPARATVGDGIEQCRRSRPPYLAAVDEQGRVEGFISAKSLLSTDPGRPLERLIRPAYVLNPEDPLDDTVGAFRRSQQAIGLVRDRTGATLGVVTSEDLLEEIVGELTRHPGAPSEGQEDRN